MVLLSYGTWRTDVYTYVRTTKIFEIGWVANFSKVWDPAHAPSARRSSARNCYNTIFVLVS